MLREMVSSSLPDFIRTPLRKARRIALHHNKPREEVQRYWKNPPAKNSPQAYFEHDDKVRTDFLVNLVESYAPKEARILELGCNVGRNLNALHQAGFTNLHGVEINAEAVSLMKEKYGDIAAVRVGSIENACINLADYDLVFTVAVFEHVHFASDWVFKEIADKAGTIITVEDESEHSYAPYIFPRNYKKVFESVGMKQVKEVDASFLPETGQAKFMARVFTKNQR